MHDIEKDLKTSLCKYCEQLNYWDGYFCDVKISQPYNLESIKSHREVFDIIECENFKERKPHEYCGLQKEICVFWCNNCKEEN